MTQQRPQNRTIFDRIIEGVERLMGHKRPIPVPVRVPVRSVPQGHPRPDRRF